MPVDERPGFRFTPQAVVGLLIIIWGLGLTAANLGLVSARRVVGFWPLALIALGYSIYARATDRGGRVAGGVMMGLGGWLTLATLASWRVGFATVWSLGLVALGVVMILRAQGFTVGSSTASTDQRQLSDFAFWSGVKRRITSSAFQRADFTAVMGGGEIDLRAAGMSGAEAILDVFVVMGGLEITVPPDWAVSNQIVAVMAGVDDKSSGTQEASHRLILRGFIMMGGIEIKT